jgi:hypothetical protein
VEALSLVEVLEVLDQRAPNYTLRSWCVFSKT